MAVLAALLLGVAAAAPVPADPVPAAATVSPARLLDWAGEMEAAGRADLAEPALKALAAHPSLPIRQEARFRLAQLAARSGRANDAATRYRAILDEEPGAQRVRLELAALLSTMGDEAGARKALREAQAGGLPPDVARFVDRFAAALRARQPFGFSFDLALAPDSNISRGTANGTLKTVLGEFALDGDARQRSGVGLAIGAQAFARTRIDARANLIARTAGSADLYRDAAFNQVAVGLSAGPELALGRDRLAIEAGASWRWFGGSLYQTSATLAATWLHPLGRTAQLRTTAAVGRIDNHRNDLQDGHSLAATASYERALSARAGVGGAIGIDRQALADPAYATTSGQFSLFGYRDFGSATLVGQLSYGRLEADARLALFPERRVDNSLRGIATVTWRALKVGSVAPLLRITAERNWSSVEVYDYRRLRTEVGITRAF